ncbi:MAG: hypothetical protein AAF098_11670 [Pseudomonadota bacterium]
MSAFSFSDEALNARNAAEDRAALDLRIRNFFPREPVSKADIRHSRPAPGTAHEAHLCCGIPEATTDQFSAEVLGHALGNHGALIVRKFFPAASSSALVQAIDRVLAACEARKSITKSNGDTAVYCNPPEVLLEALPEKQLGNARAFQKASGAAMCVESPAIAESLLESFETLGLKAILSEYLQEPPCVSVRKWMLRRSLLPVSESGWHQDGAFMGTDIKSVNLWLPLSHCGGDSGAPGMDMLPARLDEIVSAEGAVFDWSVSQKQVIGASKNEGSSRPVSPEFFPGDALFFDHFFLHRTQFRPHFDRLRYAVETWFFGSEAFPKNQVPLSW